MHNSINNLFRSIILKTGFQKEFVLWFKQELLLFFYLCFLFFWAKEFTHKAVCFTIAIHWKIAPGPEEHLSERVSFGKYVRKEDGKRICSISYERSEAMGSIETMN